MKRSIWMGALLSAALMVGCKDSSPTPTKDTPKTGSTVAGATPAPKTPPHPGLLDPSLANDPAPASYRAKFTTTKGAFTIEIYRDWAPIGADRFYNLVRVGFFSDVCFFRVISGFMAQFGINGDPRVSSAWKNTQLQDEAVKQTNARGTISFAKTAIPNTRSTQLFINFKDNTNLDAMGFAPIGRVVEGMEVVDELYNGYGGDPSNGQAQITAQGNSWLKERFPELDYITHAEILK